MIKTIKYIALLIGMFWAGSAFARTPEDKYQYWGPQHKHQLGFLFRAGYVLGGTTPLPLPKEIRSINKFNPEGGLSMALDGYKMFNRRWGLMAGVHFFIEGMHTGADVKNYHMGIVQGNSYLEGYFTGTDVTETLMTGFTIPVLATFRVSPRWNINLGPYVSLLMDTEFEGKVYNGYLREGKPTGQKVVITSENPATYDFGGDMRNVLWGLELGFDYKAARHLTVFGSLDWGLNGVFHSSFKTVDFPMYPLYATFGVACYY